MDPGTLCWTAVTTRGRKSQRPTDRGHVHSNAKRPQPRGHFDVLVTRARVTPRAVVSPQPAGGARTTERHGHTPQPRLSARHASARGSHTRCRLVRRSPDDSAKSSCAGCVCAGWVRWRGCALVVPLDIWWCASDARRIQYWQSTNPSQDSQKCEARTCPEGLCVGLRSSPWHVGSARTREASDR